MVKAKESEPGRHARVTTARLEMEKRLIEVEQAQKLSTLETLEILAGLQQTVIKYGLRKEYGIK